ncbi:MAG TPA: hypothetical protein VK530_16035 [Candidatus Acidoferrum sp.]|nr:hypothetical protein [Candidatus Acidoferrum sp.]
MRSPRRLRLPVLLLLAAACLVLTFTARAQIGVSNLVDKSSSYDDRVTFYITNSPGFTYLALLNGQPVSIGSAVLVDKPDYYELAMWRTNTTTSAVATQLVRFIVKASERVNTELGLPPHTPFPVIQSSPAEFTNARVRVIVPKFFPAGYEIPVVAWVVDEEGHAIRANGLLAAASHPTIQVKRGVGSGFLSSNNAAGPLNYAPQIAGLATNKTIDIEASTSWTPITGTLSGSTVWPANSRIHVMSGAIIPAGSSLTVGAGTIVRVDTGVSITNNGTITIDGTIDEPVVFMPTVKSQPWGGFVQHANNTTFTATGAIFTGSGLDACWYNGHGCSSGSSGLGSHRGEEALLALNGGNCNVSLTDSAAIHLAGQLGHSVGGAGKSYDIRFTRFLMQGATTGGEYSSVNFTVNDSAIIDCPEDSAEFEDGDNDSLYIVSGSGYFTNMLIGWTKDDGIDSGGGGSAPLIYQSCWFEATFHEGNSLSGSKDVFSRDTVYIDCGQGIEDGYDAPVARLDRCFFTACKSGIRFGDNYTSGYSYNGQLTATNCISIYNHRDVFGFNWAANGWTNSTRLAASNNWITTAHPYYPNNAIWNAPTDSWRLGVYGAPGRVGAGFATRGSSIVQAGTGIPIGLSRFCSNEVTVGYEIDGTDGTHLTGTLVFPEGQTRQSIPAPTNVNGVLRIGLVNVVNADVTGASSLLFQNLPPETNGTPTVLSPLGAQWKYLDDATEQGTAWRAPGFDDNTWSNGVARLGFGGDASPLATTIRRFVPGSGTVQGTNYYFRRAVVVTNATNFAGIQFRYQRDDGCVVYLNGNEVFRNNMNPGLVTANTFASNTVSGSTATLMFWTNTVSPTNFVAGTNVIAAEVHQIGNTSSDIAWEMELLGIPAPSLPRINVTQLGGGTMVFWVNGTLRLEEADFVIGPWTTVSNAPSPVTIPPGTTQKFYRLGQ